MYIYIYIYIGGRNSVVGIATRCRVDGPRIESRRDEFFRNRPDRPRGPLILLYNRYWVCFPGIKRPGCSVDYSTSVVKERIELYLYSLSELSRLVQGRTLPLCVCVFVYIYIYIYIYSVALRLNAGQSLLIFEVPRSHKLLWMSNQFVAETST